MVQLEHNITEQPTPRKGLQQQRVFSGALRLEQAIHRHPTQPHLYAARMWPSGVWSWLPHTVCFFFAVLPLHHSLNCIHVDLQLSNLTH